jgi:hypothetical protein
MSIIIVFGNGYLICQQKNEQQKKKMINCISLQWNLFTFKDLMKEMERQVIEW